MSLKYSPRFVKEFLMLAWWVQQIRQKYPNLFLRNFVFHCFYTTIESKKHYKNGGSYLKVFFSFTIFIHLFELCFITLMEIDLLLFQTADLRFQLKKKQRQVMQKSVEFKELLFRKFGQEIQCSFSFIQKKNG